MTSSIKFYTMLFRAREIKPREQSLYHNLSKPRPMVSLWWNGQRFGKLYDIKFMLEIVGRVEKDTMILKSFTDPTGKRLTWSWTFWGQHGKKLTWPRINMVGHSEKCTLSTIFSSEAVLVGQSSTHFIFWCIAIADDASAVVRVIAWCKTYNNPWAQPIITSSLTYGRMIQGVIKIIMKIK